MNYRLYNSKIISINTIFIKLLLIYLNKYYNYILNYIEFDF